MLCEFGQALIDIDPQIHRRHAKQGGEDVLVA
jgi:hypothetical protein